MKPKVLKIGVAVCLLIVAGYAAELLWAQSPPPSALAKAPIVGKVLLSATPKTLTEYCGRGSAFLFKGYVAFDPANAGAANVVKATIPGAADAPAAAGSYKEWSAVNSDLVRISGTATDYITIAGEDVEADPARRGTAY